MSIASGLSDEEVVEIRQMLEIGRIRKAKDLYSQLLDSQDERFAEIYSREAVMEAGKFGIHRSRDAIMKTIKAFWERTEPFAVLHATTNLWVELTGPESAVSRSYLLDVETGTNARVEPVKWLAVYDEDWVKEDGDWRISRLCVHFLWPERMTGDGYGRRLPLSGRGERRPA